MMTPRSVAVRKENHLKGRGSRTGRQQGVRETHTRSRLATHAQLNELPGRVMAIVLFTSMMRKYERPSECGKEGVAVRGRAAEAEALGQ